MKDEQLRQIAQLVVKTVLELDVNDSRAEDAILELGYQCYNLGRKNAAMDIALSMKDAITR